MPQIGVVQPRRVEWSPRDNDRLLVMDASGQVGIWDVADLSAPFLFASIPAGAVDARFAPDGKTLVTAGYDGRARSWTLEGDALAVSSAQHATAARALAVSADRIVTGAEDGTLRVWRSDGAAVSDGLAGHKGPVLSVAIAPKGDVVSAGADGRLRLWKPGAQPTAPLESSLLFRQKKPMPLDRFMSTLKMNPNWGWDHMVAYSPRGDVLGATLYDGSLRLWGPDGAPLAEVRGAHGRKAAHALAFSPSANLLATAGFDGQLRLWNLDGTPLGDPIQAHQDMAFSVSFSALGDRIASSGADNRVRLWTLEGAPLGELPHGEGDPVETVAVASRQPVLAIGEHNGTVRVSDLAGTLLGPPTAVPGGRLASLACSAEGDLVAAGGADGRVAVWDIAGVLRGEPMEPRQAPVGAVAFDPNAERVAAGSDGLRLLRPTGRYAGTVWAGTPSIDTITRVAFSPAGDLIVAGSLFGRLQAWSLYGEPRVAPFRLRKEWVRGVAFAPDGGSFASAGGGEDVVRLWNLDGTQQEPPLSGHRAAVSALATSAELALLASGSVDGEVRLWRFPSRDAEVIHVGLPIDQMGFERRLLWVRAGESMLFFYDAGRRLIASAQLYPSGMVVFTPDGWFGGPSAASAVLRVFDAGGASLPAAAAARRAAPERIGELLERAAAAQ